MDPGVVKELFFPKPVWAKRNYFLVTVYTPVYVIEYLSIYLSIYLNQSARIDPNLSYGWKYVQEDQYNIYIYVCFCSSHAHTHTHIYIHTHTHTYDEQKWLDNQEYFCN